MSNHEDLKTDLARVGYEAERRGAWANFLLDQAITPENFDAKKMPMGVIDADLLLLSNRHRVNPTALFYIAQSFANQLVPTPESIETWDQVIELLQAHTHLISHRTKNNLANIAQNETFLKRLESSPNTHSFSAWETQVACGELFDLLAVSLSYMHRRRVLNTPMVRAYNQMIRRLKAPLDSTSVVIESGLAKTIITVHSRFRPEFVPPMREKFSDSLYSVLAEKLVTTQQINAERIVMLKKLKRGTSVMIAADGKKGNHNATGLIFNRDANISDGFAWVAWMAKCPVVWAYAALGEQSTGLKAYARVLLEAPAPETDFKSYSSQLIAAYFSAVEDAIIQHPFGFGLLYPKRIGDRRPATPP